MVSLNTQLEIAWHTSGMVLPNLQISHITSQLNNLVPEEACGLVAGKIRPGTSALALAVFPITNSRHSPVRFHMDPGEQLQAFQAIDAAGLDLLAIYHSHPNGPSSPSETDVREATYPELLHLIFSPGDQDWQCRAYSIINGAITPVPIFLTKGETA